MNAKNILTLILILILIGIGALYYLTKDSSEAKTKKMPPSSSYVQGEILVKFKEGTPTREILALKEKLEVKEETFTETISLYHWKGNFDTTQALELLKKSPLVQYAEPNYKVEIQKK